MNKPELVFERRFADSHTLAAALNKANESLSSGDVAYVSVFGNDTEEPATLLRLWKGKCTDGSSVYEVHIL